jgi:hypothetical protein
MSGICCSDDLLPYEEIMSTSFWWWKNSKSLNAFNRSCDAYQMLCWGVQKVYIQKKG